MSHPRKKILHSAAPFFQGCDIFNYHTLNWNAGFWLVHRCALICNVLPAVQNFFWFLHGIKCRTASDFIVLIQWETYFKFIHHKGVEPMSSQLTAPSSTQWAHLVYYKKMLSILLFVKWLFLHLYNSLAFVWYQKHYCCLSTLI